MPVHHDDLARRELARGVEHVGEQRPARERLQHFRQAGAHALAQPCRENDDMNRGSHDERGVETFGYTPRLLHGPAVVRPRSCKILVHYNVLARASLTASSSRIDAPSAR